MFYIIKKNKKGFEIESVEGSNKNTKKYFIPCIIKKTRNFVPAYSDSIKDLFNFGFKEYKSYGFFINEKEFNGSKSYLEQHYPLLRERKYTGINGTKVINRDLLRLHSDKFEYDKASMKYGMYSPTDTISEGKDYSFGVEMETSSGSIPGFYSNLLNIKSEFDGSIRGDNGEKAWGGEYVTGILNGDYGFFHLNEICRVLSTYTKVNKTCSVHVHLGNIKFNKENVVFLWMLFKSIEDQIFRLVPSSRRSNNYCNKMSNKSLSIKVYKNDYTTSIESSYKNIVKIISLGSEPSHRINKKLNHPSGRTCGYNKSTPRYWWINFVPTLFSIHGNNSNTLEIRLHSATTNYIKIRNLILLFMGLVSFAENNKNDILENNTDIYYILKKTFPNKGQYLVDYFKEREAFFSETNSERKEYEKENPSNNLKIKKLI